jgi:tetratricopeptide (TPR) repeat protein
VGARQVLVFFAVLFTSLVSSAASVRAQESPRDSEVADTQARAHYETGERAYREGRFADAIQAFRRAHELSDRPELLFNIGQAADRLDHHAAAAEAFEAYLRERPNAPNRSYVEGRLSVLRRRTSVAAETEAQNDGPGIVPWLLVALAAAAAVSAGVFFVLREQALGTCTTDGDVGVCDTEADATRAGSDARRWNTLTNVMLGVTGGAAVVGGVWLVAEASW